MKSTMPLTSAWVSRSSTGASRHASSLTVDLALRFDRLGELDQALGGIGAAVEQDVLDQFEQVLGDLLVNGELPGVDDAHVEPGVDGVIQKGGVHRLAHGLLPRKEKEMLLMPPLTRARGRFSLIQRVASMKSTA